MTVVEFKRPRKKSSTLCRHNHHKWEVYKERRFDVKQGKLVTLYRCARCGKQKVKSH